MNACPGRAVLLVAVAAATVATLACAGGCGSPASGVPAAPPSPLNVTDPRTGPADPQVGVGYPFDLYTHCGIGTARFGGRYWQATPPRPEPARRPGPDGIVSYTGYTAGTMTLLGADLLRFVIADPQAVGDGDSIDFVPLPAEAAPPPPCQ